MRNKGFIIFIASLITLLCIYYLSFTFVSRNVNQKATAYATDESGQVDYFKRQSYLDSVWRKPVYNLFGISYTLQEVKQNELNLGLDLQGGMHVTLEVSPIEIIKGLSGNSEDRAFNEAIEQARVTSRTSQEDFVTLFYRAYRQIRPDGNFASIFSTAANRGRISLQSSDQDVLRVINGEVEDAIDRAFNILRTRVDRFGTSTPNIQRIQGTGRIQIELPGVDNPQRVRNLLQGVAKLEFWEVLEIQEIAPTLESINTVLVAEQKEKLKVEDIRQKNTLQGDSLRSTDPKRTQERISDATGTSDSISDDLASQLSQVDGNALDSIRASSDISPIYSLLKSPYGLVYDVRDTASINRVLQRREVRAMIPGTIKFLWGHKPNKLTDGTEVLELYAVRVARDGRAPLTGEVITDARQDLDQSARPGVNMQMNATGAKKWRRLTADNVNRRIAIVLDNYVYSAPVVQNEIPGGNSAITGNFSLEEAKDLANILKAGTLPAPTRIVEEAVVGPTLGREAQVQGVVSILSGLAIVVLFMIAYYSGGGLIANLALLFNVFFILGILANFGAALTLPGIAGIVLTIGMAIDANVLIFERIREELRNGAGLKAAISAGYDKAYSSIIDSNATTFLTGVILYVLGQGPVKGFAVTLMIGIFCSFFSAVFISRVFVEYFSKKGDQSKLSFATPFSKNWLSGLNFDFLSKRKTAYIGSGIFIAIGFIAMIAQGGLNLGVDFRGGRSYVVEFSEPVTATELRSSLVNYFEGEGTEVKSYGVGGGRNVMKVTTSYLVNDETIEADTKVEQALISGISKEKGIQYVQEADQMDAQTFSILSSAKVGANIADDIKSASQQAIVFSLVLIFLYILIRFKKWQFGLGALVAVFHDALFVLAAFAIAGVLGLTYEVDQVFIAAMLTIIGYSINDTVVVFDRIRENLGLYSKADFVKTLNGAINDTLNRTVITSLTTLVVVVILFIFGGEVLRGFSFALIVGILVGTYSSIFIATPVVVDFSKNKQVGEGVKVATATTKQKA
jgi:SecD/SecF fusion protein